MVLFLCNYSILAAFLSSDALIKNFFYNIFAKQILNSLAISMRSIITLQFFRTQEFDKF